MPQYLNCLSFVTGPGLQEKQQYLEAYVVWAASMRLLGQFRSLKPQFFFKLLLILDVCTRSSNVYGNPSVGIATKARCYANCLTQVRQPFNILSQQATTSSLSALNRIGSFFQVQSDCCVVSNATPLSIIRCFQFLFR